MFDPHQVQVFLAVRLVLDDQAHPEDKHKDIEHSVDTVSKYLTH